MPSIPQSLLWISLVVLWLFVLVPMLISKRDAVRRTSDVALSTRVLNSAGNSRLLKRAGPASGHRSDPDWQPSEDELDDDYDDFDEKNYCLVGRRHHHKYQLGDAVRIKVARANIEKRQLDFTLADDDE